MVVGKGGDTIAIATQPLTAMSPVVKDSLLASSHYTDGALVYKMNETQEVSVRKRLKIYLGAVSWRFIGVSWVVLLIVDI